MKSLLYIRHATLFIRRQSAEQSLHPEPQTTALPQVPDMVSHYVLLCLASAILLWANDSWAGNVGVCITNCGQCKQMYGHYFQGQLCAEACLESNGRLLPDCNNPNTLRGFLKRLY
ncbi:uncharacterized protein [Periplaneta americana]|uniref:uncharacterized protein n=1 Tax=Periplaneta americana TaxID=6978 RepID=UPI0037E91D39